MQYDIGTQSYIGKITVPLAKSSVETEATHALVFILVGLSSKYKQIVAYEFTGVSTNANCFLDIIMSIVVHPILSGKNKLNKLRVFDQRSYFRPWI